MQQARKMSTANRPVRPVQPTREYSPGAQRARRLKKAKLITIALTCFILGLVVIAQYSSLVILNYRLSSVRSDLARSGESARALELEAAQLGAVSRIDQLAREELGMVEPEIDQVQVINISQRGRYQPGE